MARLRGRIDRIVVCLNAGTCPTGKAYGSVDSSAPDVSPVTFIPASSSSVEKLRVTFSASARTSAFMALRRDQGFSVRIMTIANQANGYGTFTWKFDEDEYYHDETKIADSTTEGTARALVSGAVGTGVFVYFDATLKGTTDLTQLAAGDTYYFTLSYNDGISFDEADSNTAHQEIECSGQGSCDSGTGKCSCNKGFTGSACERST